MPLSDDDRAMLALEAEWQRHSEAKERAIDERLGLTSARYYQLLARLIETEAAIEADPLLVKRLRRLRDERRAERASRTGVPTRSG